MTAALAIQSRALKTARAIATKELKDLRKIATNSSTHGPKKETKTSKR